MNGEALRSTLEHCRDMLDEAVQYASQSYQFGPNAYAYEALIRGDELRMLRELQRNTTGAFVFETERGGPFTADAVNRLVKTIGARAKLSFGVHAHMLRHACGYALANAGHDTRLIQDWLGHRAIQHTARYTELSPTRFKDVWR
jgi:site-specific recombinase XerD